MIAEEGMPAEPEAEDPYPALNEIENGPDNDSEGEEGEKKKLKTKHIYRSWKRASKSTNAPVYIPIDLDME